ncbi:MAG: phage portal protein [Gemmatimonadaceae bacterium]
MGLFDRKSKAEPETRAVVGESQFTSLVMGTWLGTNEANELVNTDTALSVPAVWAAVNFLARTLASLPINVYRKTSSGRNRITGGLQTILHDAWTPEHSSFRARLKMWTDVFTTGRAVVFIERAPAGNVINLWPLDPSKVTVSKSPGQETQYSYSTGNGRSVNYAASEVLDIPFFIKADGLEHRGPIVTNSQAIGLAIAVTKQAARFYSNGGVPPFVVTGQFQSAGALQKSQADFREAIKKAAANKEQALVLPANMDIKAVGTNAEQQQLTEAQRWCVEQVARIYSLPPTFLQDLTHGTYSNTEQQDLHLTKHTLRGWIEQFEQELNLKLWGRARSGTYAEVNVDAMLRGDFTTRMQGYATAIQNAVMMPNEARQRENMPDDPAGGALLIQGATVPLGSQPVANEVTNNDASN